MSMQNGPFRSFIFLFTVLLLLVGCDGFPRDPEGSLERIRDQGVLRVGAIFNSPWVTDMRDNQLNGMEGELVRGFAEELGVEVETVWGGDQELFEALIHNELDVMVGGFTAKNPWMEQVGFTSPYYISRTLIAIPPEHPPISDIEDMPVAIEPVSALRQLIERKGAKPVELDDPFTSDGPVAAASWEIAGQGYEPAGIELHKREHVIVVAPGENALLLELERYLFRHNDSATLEKALWGASGQ